MQPTGYIQMPISSNINRHCKIVAQTVLTKKEAKKKKDPNINLLKKNGTFVLQKYIYAAVQKKKKKCAFFNTQIRKQKQKGTNEKLFLLLLFFS